MVCQAQFDEDAIMEAFDKSSAYAVFNIDLHVVFVTRCRRKTLSPELQDSLRGACLGAWHCKLLECGGEPDHVHWRIDIHPALDISVLIKLRPAYPEPICRAAVL